eukprot:TRINITY_DN1991_c0_g1_i1.p1 TRINITY_DN1991_c0_g1~~TRINITY_DN1991_c0_g1_i1.p1  ORF type:complete len:104 (-),score=8.65 TRINITY_DN1991_c0_g1_i1:90-401(-)
MYFEVYVYKAAVHVHGKYRALQLTSMRAVCVPQVLGGGQVPKAVELGMAGMREGGRRRIVVPPALGMHMYVVWSGLLVCIPRSTKMCTTVLLMQRMVAPTQAT